MTFHPVLPAVALLVISAVVVLIRVVALYRILLRTGSRRYRPVVARWSGLTVAVMMLLLAASRPGFDSDQAGPLVDLNPQARVEPNLNVFFVVDRSVNSRVEDFGNGESRMAGIRSDIGAMIDEYSHARFALISYATKASMDWPLSDDATSLRSVIKGLSPYTLVAPDAIYEANAFAARDVLRDKVDEAAQIFPGSKSLVFYFGEGAPHTHAAAVSFDIARGKIAGGAVLGYGTAVGGPIPQGWVDGKKVYQGDPEGNLPLNSTIDEARLKDIAGQLNVPYFHRENGQSVSGMVSVFDQTANAQQDSDRLAAQLSERHELYWVFTMLAAVLLVAEIGLTIRQYRRNRMCRRDIGR